MMPRAKMIPMLRRATPRAISDLFDTLYEPEPNTGCHLWIGSLISLGYGSFRAKSAHRYAWRRLHGQSLTPPRLKNRCGQPSCVNTEHWEELLPPPPLLEKLAQGSHITANGCFEWTGGKNESGYGVVSVQDERSGKWKGEVAHRVAWKCHYGPIPLGLLVCHHCDNPPCWNEAHLFLGTQKDNMQDMMRKGRGRNSPCVCKLSSDPSPRADHESNAAVVRSGDDTHAG